MGTTSKNMAKRDDISKFGAKQTVWPSNFSYYKFSVPNNL
jgi:hypothetical protein